MRLKALHISSIFFLLFFTLGQLNAQNNGYGRDMSPEAMAKREADLDSALTSFHIFLDQLADVDQFDKALEARKLGRNQALKDSISNYYENIGIDLTMITALRINEFWARALTPKKAYSTTGNYDTLEVEQQVGNDIIFRINVDSVSSMNEFIIQSSVTFSESLRNFLFDRKFQGLEQQINQYLADTLNGRKVTTPKEYKQSVIEASSWMYQLLLSKLSSEDIKRLIEIKDKTENAEENFPFAGQDFLVEFQYDPKLTTYGFDKYDPSYGEQAKANYPKVNLGDGTTNYTPFKSVEKKGDNNYTDYVYYKFINKRIDSIKIGELRMVNSDGYEYNSVTEIIGVGNNPEDGYQQRLIPLKDIEKDLTIYAYYKEHKIGKIKIKALKPITKTVRIVPVGAQTLTAEDKTQIQQQLKKVYKQSCVTWTVELAEPFVPEDFENGFIFPVPEDEGIEQYTAEMRELRQQYQAKNKLTGKPHLIFLIDGFSQENNPDQETNTTGYMPRGRGMGFLKRSTLLDGHTLAHELGHGAFGLEHTFHDAPETENKTKNLMDYANGNFPAEEVIELTQLQWKYMRKPLPTFSYRDETEDAANVEDYNVDWTNLFGMIRSKLDVPWNLNNYYNGSFLGFSNSIDTDEGKVKIPQTVDYDGEKIRYSITSYYNKQDKYIDYEKYRISGDIYGKYNLSFYSNDIDETLLFSLNDLSCESIAHIERGAGIKIKPLIQKSLIKFFDSRTKNYQSENGATLHSIYWRNYVYPQCRINVPVEKRINYLKTFMDEEDLAVMLCQGITDPEDIRTFHEALTKKEGSKSTLLEQLEGEINDFEPLKPDDAFGKVTLELLDQMKKSYTQISDFKAVAGNQILNDDKRIIVWEGAIQSRTSSIYSSKTYYSSTLENGKVHIKKFYSPGYQAGKLSTLKSKELINQIYDPFNDWFLLIVAKDVEGVSFQKGSVIFVNAFTLHSMIRGNQNAIHAKGVQLGLALGGTILTAGTSGAFTGARAILTTVELAAATSEIALLTGRDYYINNNILTKEEYQELLMWSGIGQMAGLASFRGSMVGKRFRLSAGNLHTKLSQVDLKKLPSSRQTQIKEIKENLKAVLDEGSDLVKNGARSLDEILVNGKIPTIKKGFNKWYDDLTLEEFDMIWSNSKLKETLGERIRYPAKYHEWCMVCESRKFKEWGVSMDEIHRFRTKTLELKGVNPNTGEAFAHSIKNTGGRVVSGPGSKTFHNELQTLIQQSNSLDDFNNALPSLIERWQIDSSLIPSLPK